MGIFNKITSYLDKVNSFENAVKMAPNKIGVYIFAYEGQVKYVGRAIEFSPGQDPTGLRKRLQEHWEGAATGNEDVYDLRDSITVKVKTCATVEKATELKASLIMKYDTVNKGWNISYKT